jgi:hypothetical protein
MTFGVEKSSKPGEFPTGGTPIYGQVPAALPRYGLGQKTLFFVDKPVDGLPRISPQARPDLLAGISPTSGREPQESNQIYGLRETIHILHSPYYYYESQYIVNE